MESGLRRGLPIPATNPKAFAARASGTRPKLLRLTVARRRRLFTVFPCAESPVIVDGAPRRADAACGSWMHFRVTFQRNSLVTSSQNHARAPSRPHFDFE